MINLNIKDMKFTKKQKKLAMIAGVIVIAFVIFVRFIYIPQKSKFEELKKELSEAEREIGEIKKSAGADGETSMATALEGLQKKLKALNERLPPKEEMILRELPAFASRFGIEIRSMQPQKKRAVTQIGKAELSVKGYAIEEIQVSILATANYKDLGEYVRVLKDEFPVVIKINSLTLSSGSREERSQLNVTLNITAYLLSPA